jgi:hypothetical protein
MGTSNVPIRIRLLRVSGFRRVIRAVWSVSHRQFGNTDAKHASEQTGAYAMEPVRRVENDDANERAPGPVRFGSSSER